MRGAATTCRIAIWAAVVGLWAPVCLAQPWQAIPLHPQGAIDSEVYAVSPTQQFGTISDATTGIFGPAFWSGSAGSFTALAGAGSIHSVSGDQWAGVLGGHATVWSGPSHTPTSFHVPGFAISEIAATTGEWQAGAVSQLVGTASAVVWHGTPGSATLLHPPGAYESVAAAADGEHQGGWVTYPGPLGAGPEHAAIWSGTAASVVDLNPAGHPWSRILGMGGGSIVGVVGNAVGESAAFWPTSGAPYVDLNPPGVLDAELDATCGSAQVGIASTNAFGSTAAIWFGSRDSFVPLSAFLPPGYRESGATSVAEDHGTFYVGGWAVSNVTGRTEAFLWVGVPAPGAAVALLGGLWLSSRPARRRYRSS